MDAVGVGQVKLAWAATSPGTIGTGVAHASLSDGDLLRAAGFGPDRRRAFVLGRSLIAALVRELFPNVSGWSVGTGACRLCGARHGPVEITGAAAVASVSYAPGLVVAAAAPGRRVDRIGVDVEPERANATRTRDLERLLGPSHEPVLRRWTRIEAVLKADGRGLLIDPGEVRLRSGGGRIAGDPARYRVADVAGPAGSLVSLAWCGAEASAAGCDPASG